MKIDYNKKYFLMSYKFDKDKPEDFGLTKSNNNGHLFIDKQDNSEWIKEELYDFGWGNENGYIRLPKLSFLELWDLLKNSQLKENRYGAAYLLEKEYPNTLLNQLSEIINSQNTQITETNIEIFNILKLDCIKNRNEIIGKSFSEINKDYENWKTISEKVNEIISHRGN